MTHQANIQEQTVLLTVDQLTNVLNRHSSGNEQIAGAIKLVGGLMSAALTIYSAVTIVQTVLAGRGNFVSDGALQLSKLDSAKMNVVHEWLDTYFDKDELRDLCFDLDIDFEDLEGTAQTHKARELVEFYARRGELDRLEAIVKEERPHLNSQEFVR